MNEQHIFPPATAQETFFCIRQIYDDACPVDVSCAVRNVHEKHWIWTTRLALCILKISRWFSSFFQEHVTTVTTDIFVPVWSRFISFLTSKDYVLVLLVGFELEGDKYVSRQSFDSKLQISSQFSTLWLTCEQHTPRKCHMYKGFLVSEQKPRAKSGEVGYPSYNFEGKYTDTLSLQTKTVAIETFHMRAFDALQVVLSIKLLILQDLSHSPARLAEILEERLKPIHDFETQEPKDVEVNVWMTSMANLLQILRSLSLTQHLFWGPFPDTKSVSKLWGSKLTSNRQSLWNERLPMFHRRVQLATGRFDMCCSPTVAAILKVSHFPFIRNASKFHTLVGARVVCTFLVAAGPLHVPKSHLYIFLDPASCTIIWAFYCSTCTRGQVPVQIQYCLTYQIRLGAILPVDASLDD